ncbi:zinc metallopeptidase [Candidatus Bipolaricaulota bacterium]|nr:zinc metallopeptidase [Candidatus Bipolaricaulota bacterium]
MFGSSILIVLPALLLAAYAQYKVRSTYKRYARVETITQTSAAAMAEWVMASQAVTGVSIEQTLRGSLSDHYDPRARALRLSDPESTSVAAVGVAAHEAGHAIQHAQSFKPLVLRSTIVPAAQIASRLAIPLLIVGMVFQFSTFVTVGVALFSAAVLVALASLPVEFDASRRAVVALRSSQLLSEEELGAVKEVLFAAALTYVAAAAVAALQLLMLLSSSRRR